MDILDQALELRASRQPFALATVVAVQPPTSATPGARAIIRPDGSITGWIGGGCAQETVVSQAMKALEDESPRLVVLSPEPSAAPSRPSVVEVPMMCASQGELQVYLEPFLPKVELAVVGVSPVAVTLAQLGTLLGFGVRVCDPQARAEEFPTADELHGDLASFGASLSERSLVVVATIGQYDEDAVAAALESHAAYVGLVASQRRLAAVLDVLGSRGLSAEGLARIRRPAGLPAKTVLPSEIAFSVMAELLEVRREHRGLASETAAAPEVAEAVDPICGMTVSVAGARYTSQREGRTYYFCCAGCKSKFESA